MDAPQPATPRADGDKPQAPVDPCLPARAEGGATADAAAAPTTLERVRALWCTFVRGLG